MILNLSQIVQPYMLSLHFSLLFFFKRKKKKNLLNFRFKIIINCHL